MHKLAPEKFRIESGEADHGGILAARISVAFGMVRPFSARWKYTLRRILFVRNGGIISPAEDLPNRPPMGRFANINDCFRLLDLQLMFVPRVRLR